MVLLLLGVIWAAVLVPPWLQNRREARPTASIRSFHRQLWLLGRTSPGYAASPGVVARQRGARGAASPFAGVSSGVTVYGDDPSGRAFAHGPAHVPAHHVGQPAHDLEHDDSEYEYDDDLDDPELAAAARVNGARVNGARVRSAGRADGFYEPAYDRDLAYERAFDPRYGTERYDFYEGSGESDESYDDDSDGYADVYDAPYGDLRGFDDLDHLDPRAGARWAEVAEARRRRMAERSPAEMRRRAQGYRRRRRVLSVLLVCALVTAPPAAFAGGTMWWAAQIVADVLLVGYVSLLVQRQRRALEREEKVHYLAPIQAPRPAVVVLHGGAAH
jgi:hypothetical protein